MAPITIPHAVRDATASASRSFIVKLPALGGYAMVPRRFDFVRAAVPTVDGVREPLGSLSSDRAAGQLAIVPLAVVICIEAYLASRVATGNGSPSLAVATTILFATVWYVLPRFYQGE
jgi:hypothetical protein